MERKQHPDRDLCFWPSYLRVWRQKHKEATDQEYRVVERSPLVRVHKWLTVHNKHDWGWCFEHHIDQRQQTSGQASWVWSQQNSRHQSDAPLSQYCRSQARKHVLVWRWEHSCQSASVRLIVEERTSASRSDCDVLRTLRCDKVHRAQQRRRLDAFSMRGSLSAYLGHEFSAMLISICRPYRSSRKSTALPHSLLLCLVRREVPQCNDTCLIELGLKDHAVGLYRSAETGPLTTLC